MNEQVVEFWKDGEYVSETKTDDLDKLLEEVDENRWRYDVYESSGVINIIILGKF